MSQVLNEFVKEAFRLGKTRAETDAVLRQAGWGDEQLASLWSQYHDTSFVVPVPKPSLNVSPRYAVLNVFFFIVLLLTIWAGCSIIFTFLDYYLPDGLGRNQGMFYSAGRNIGDALRSHLSMIAVCAPLVIFTSRLITRTSAQGAQSVPVIRLKLIYLMFFFAAFVLLIDFVLFVNYFLSGELGIRFMLKVAVCASVATGIYYYFRTETNSVEKRA